MIGFTTFRITSLKQGNQRILWVGASFVVGEVKEARHALSQAVGDLVHPEEATQEAEPARMDHAERLNWSWFLWMNYGVYGENIFIHQLLTSAHHKEQLVGVFGGGGWTMMTYIEFNIFCDN